MQPPLTPLDIAALTEALPERGSLKGQVGTVVEALAPPLRPPRANAPAVAQPRTRCVHGWVTPPVHRDQ